MAKSKAELEREERYEKLRKEYDLLQSEYVMHTQQRAEAERKARGKKKEMDRIMAELAGLNG